MLGSAITLTTAGIPMLLQGEEMLTTNQFGANVPIDWSYTNTWNGVVNYYRDLIRLRRNLDGRSSGLLGEASSIIWTDNRTNSPMIAYRRWSTGNAGDDVVVICNFGETNWSAYGIGPSGGGQLGFPKDGAWYVQLNSDWSKYCADYGNYGSSGSITVSGGSGTFSIAPYSVLILSQNIPGPAAHTTESQGHQRFHQPDYHRLERLQLRHRLHRHEQRHPDRHHRHQQLYRQRIGHRRHLLLPSHRHQQLWRCFRHVLRRLCHDTAGHGRHQSAGLLDL